MIWYVACLIAGVVIVLASERLALREAFERGGILQSGWIFLGKSLMCAIMVHIGVWAIARSLH